MEHVQVVVSIPCCNYTFSCFYLLEFHLFIKLLLSTMKPKFTKKITRFRLLISPEKTLAITLRFFATGETCKSLTYQYRVSEVSIWRFVPEICQVIIESFMGEYISLPDSKEKRLSVEKEFEEKWQFPNCVGAIDGKHVPLINPFSSGSTFSVLQL